MSATKALWRAYKVAFSKERVRPWALVVPVINEGQRLTTLLKRVSDLNLHSLCDVIVCDGGSNDGSVTPDTLGQHNVTTLLSSSALLGVSVQLQAAYHHCLANGYRGILTIDGNNKDDPEAVPRMIQRLEEGFDFVQASRFICGGGHKNTPLLRLLAIKMFHVPILRLSSGFAWTDTTQGFRGYSAEMLRSKSLGIFEKEFRRYSLLFYMSYRAPRLGFRVTEVPSIRNYPRGEIPTKISFGGSLRIALDVLQVVSGKFNK